MKDGGKVSDKSSLSPENEEDESEEINFEEIDGIAANDDSVELTQEMIDRILEEELFSKRYSPNNSSTQITQIIVELVATAETLPEVSERVISYLGGKIRPSVADADADEEGILMKNGRRVRIVVLTPDMRKIEIGRRRLPKK